MGNPHHQALDEGVRPESFSSEAFFKRSLFQMKPFSNEALGLVAKMQLDPQMKPKRANCPKLQQPNSREGDLTDARPL
jgi:hypothetical protein